jgi:hypothetical protein
MSSSAAAPTSAAAAPTSAAADPPTEADRVKLESFLVSNSDLVELSRMFRAPREHDPSADGPSFPEIPFTDFRRIIIVPVEGSPDTIAAVARAGLVGPLECLLRVDCWGDEDLFNAATAAAQIKSASPRGVHGTAPPLQAHIKCADLLLGAVCKHIDSAGAEETVLDFRSREELYYEYVGKLVVADQLVCDLWFCARNRCGIGSEASGGELVKLLLRMPHNPSTKFLSALMQWVDKVGLDLRRLRLDKPLEVDGPPVVTNGTVIALLIIVGFGSPWSVWLAHQTGLVKSSLGVKFEKCAARPVTGPSDISALELSGPVEYLIGVRDCLAKCVELQIGSPACPGFDFDDDQVFEHLRYLPA